MKTKEKNTKKQFKYFTIFEHEKEEDYLREMHKSGWKLVKVNGFGMFHFEKCIPEDVVYQLDYNIEGLAHKEEYLQMFSDCGWEFIQDYASYSYFRKPVSEEGVVEKIFYDEESKIEMKKRVLRVRLIPLIIFFLLTLIMLIISIFVLHNYDSVAIFSGLLIPDTIALIIFAVKYFQYKNSLRK